jgi:hypothetical protein
LFHQNFIFRVLEQYFPPENDEKLGCVLMDMGIASAGFLHAGKGDLRTHLIENVSAKQVMVFGNGHSGNIIDYRNLHSGPP